ncbi:ABC transporter permease [Leekyejoonella antrihumi]|uniref:ABC transporter permease n=2 Tax=Leekyejoonella antrihumi TaxID=1660198 RepID=A0A563E838_9MICO|nr:ABC transporter permease [Leekyejoonella antrihumi]
MLESLQTAAPRVDGSPFSSRLRTFAGNKAALVGLVILLIFVILAVFAPLLTSQDPTGQNLAAAFQPPSAKHWLGTDDLGRDILARIMYGGRYTLLIGLVAVSIATIIGVPLGLISGYLGGVTDTIIQRITDIMLSFNPFLLALMLVAVFGAGAKSVTIAAGIGVIPQFIRLARGQALSIREEVYVEAAVAFGEKPMAILRRHVMRNSLAPIIVYATLNIGLTILVAAGLGFLGLGVQPPAPEWGTMLGEARSYIFHASYQMTFPGLAIFLAVLSFNLLGDGLRDAVDPSLRD